MTENINQNPEQIARDKIDQICGRVRLDSKKIATFEMLELYDGKLSRTVLRGLTLPDTGIIAIKKTK